MTILYIYIQFQRSGNDEDEDEDCSCNTYGDDCDYDDVDDNAIVSIDLIMIWSL